MAKRCFICGKGTETGFQLSHSHIRTKRKWKSNIQKIKAIVNGTPRKIKVCTRCLKSGKIQRAI